MILTLARDNYWPEEHEQHLDLAADYPNPDVAVAGLILDRKMTDSAGAVRRVASQLGSIAAARRHAHRSRTVPPQANEEVHPWRTLTNHTRSTLSLF